MKRRVLLIGVLLAAAAAAGWFAWRWHTAPAPPAIALSGVDKLTADAVGEALDLVRRRPRSGEAWGELAMLLTANGFHEHVPYCYEQAERFDPETADWPYLHGVHLLESDPGKAVAALQRALTLTENPETLAAMHFRLAQALVEQHHLEAAEAHVQALAALEPDSARVRWSRAVLALNQGDRATAQELLSALSRDPFVQRRASTLLAGLVDQDEARTLQQRVQQLPTDQAWPDPIEAKMLSRKVDRTSRFDEFYALDTQGRHEEAIDFLRRMAAEAPDAETCFTLGYAYYVRGDFELAEKTFRAALRFDSKNVKTRFLISSCLLLRAEKLVRQPDSAAKARDLFRQAVSAADDALRLQPEHGLAHMTRGRALKHLRQYDEALTSLERALLILPEMADTHLFLGETLAEAGRVAEAIPHLENAVRFAKQGDRRPSEALAKVKKAKMKSAPGAP